MPGGFGTLDEIFETTVLMQTGKIKNFPVVLMGVEFWTPMFEYFRERLLREHTIDVRDIDHLMLTDSVDEAMAAHPEAGDRRLRAAEGARPQLDGASWASSHCGARTSGAEVLARRDGDRYSRYFLAAASGRPLLLGLLLVGLLGVLGTLVAHRGASRCV